jgi:hypothetical protein
MRVRVLRRCVIDSTDRRFNEIFEVRYPRLLHELLEHGVVEPADPDERLAWLESRARPRRNWISDWRH